MRIQRPTVPRSAPEDLEQQRHTRTAVAERDAGDPLVGVEVQNRAASGRRLGQVRIADRAVHAHQVLLDAEAGDLHVREPARWAIRSGLGRNAGDDHAVTGSPTVAQPDSTRTSLDQSA
jgi:hypothetical protein